MKRNNQQLQPHWRPNFQIQSTLPDIKAIRTDSVINFIAFVVALICGIIVVQREYRAFSLASSIGALEQRILVAEPNDRQHLKVSGHFRQAVRHVEELQKFHSSPLSTHKFLAELAMSKPLGLILSRISVIESIDKVAGKPQLGYRIDITGDVSALTSLTEFKEILKEFSSLNSPGFVSSVDERMQKRDAKTGSFPFRITITLTPELRTAKKSDVEGESAG